MSKFKYWKVSYKVYGYEDEQIIGPAEGDEDGIGDVIEIGARTPVYGNVIQVVDDMLVAGGTTGVVAEYVARAITETINKINDDLIVVPE